MKESTKNIYEQKVNEIIDYISVNLHTPLSLDIIADKTNVSERQLIRIMNSALNESLHSYIARQRIERAVLYMQIEEISLTELSEKVGYSTPQSFAKAFKKQFGISPKAYMGRLQSKLKTSVNKIDLHSEVCDFKGLELVYIRIFGKYGETEPYELAWKKLLQFVENNDAWSTNIRYIGLSFDDPNVTSTNKCRFYACVSVQKRISSNAEFGKIYIPQGRYAIYNVEEGNCGLQELYNNISLNFQHTIRHGMSFEEYIDKTTKVYIPIK